ncbi:MAG: hypothetical protein ACE5G7_04995, partial [Candidatus Hydrothermarchaeaceae archaeon]
QPREQDFYSLRTEFMLVRALGEEGVLVGDVFTYFSKVGVAGIKLVDTLKAGDRIRIQGHTTNFEQVVESMQIEHDSVEGAGRGESVGLKVVDRVRPHDKVFKLS